MRRRLHTRAAVAFLALIILLVPFAWSWSNHPSLVPALVSRLVPTTSAMVIPGPGWHQTVIIRKSTDGTIRAFDANADWPEWALEPVVPAMQHGSISPSALTASEWGAEARTREVHTGLVAPFLTLTRDERVVHQTVISSAAPITDDELLALARANADGSGSWFDLVAADGRLRGSLHTGWSVHPLGLAHDALWLLALIALADALVHHRRWLRRPRDPGLCPACGYPRLGLPAGPCPECGAALT